MSSSSNVHDIFGGKARASSNQSLNAAPRTGGVRFAPSPTGRFHLGNLRTAWISLMFARHLDLPWIVRYEDIDKPRVLAGARDQQRSDLMSFGFLADTELLQSEFHSRHLQLFLLARSMGAIYPCTCSRREVQAALAGLASAPHDGVAPVYSGHCRFHSATEVSNDGGGSNGAVAWRFKMSREDGHDDFIIARTNSLDDLSSFVPGYHWACAIDDFDGGYDLIVRSVDLASALPLQRAIQTWISSAEAKPAYFMRAFHTSLVTSDDGHRLEKRTLGVTLPELEEAGWSPDKLERAFIASFDTSLFEQIEDDAREIAPAITLSNLLNR